MKDRIINIVFAAMSVVFGIVLILVGVHELGVDTDVAADEDVIDTMIFIVPGILLIADAAVYMLRPGRSWGWRTPSSSATSASCRSPAS